MAAKLSGKKAMQFMVKNIEPTIVDEFTIIIPTKYSNLNQVLERFNKFRFRNFKTKDSITAIQAWIDAGAPKIVGPYKVLYEHIRSDKRTDPPNIAAWAEKIIPDAINCRHLGVDNLAIDDDTWKLYRGSQHIFTYKKGENATRVTFTAVNADNF